MPYGDGTGPLGLGPGTGWGRGPCGRGRAFFRRGYWCRRAYGTAVFGAPPTLTKEEQIKILEAELKEIEAEKQEIERTLKELKKQ